MTQFYTATTSHVWRPFRLSMLRVVGSESNTSRVARLCWKYQIPPASFFNHFLSNRRPVNRSFFDFEIAAHLNSYTDKTIFHEGRLNEVLLQDPVEHHSYSYLSSILDSGARGFLAGRKRWCSECYRARRVPDPDVRENGIFDDLYWSVSPIQICMLHGCQLSDKCPHCFVKQPYISTSVEPGYCHNCRKFLGSSNTKSIELDELQAQIRQFQFFYLVTFDKLRPDPSMLRRNLEALKACHPMGESGSLALLMGVSEDVVRNWMNGKRKPKLATLFQLQSALGLAGIHQLFYPETVFLRRVLVQRNYGLRFDARPEHKSLELESQIGDFIHTMLVGINQTMSRKELANKFGVTMGYLQYRFGSQLRQLSRQHLERLAEEKTKRDSDARVLIDRAVSQVISRNKSTTIENVMADVPRGRRELVEALSETEMNLLILKARQRRNHIQDTPDLNLSEDDDF